MRPLGYFAAAACENATHLLELELRQDREHRARWGRPLFGPERDRLSGSVRVLEATYSDGRTECITMHPEGVQPNIMAIIGRPNEVFGARIDLQPQRPASSSRMHGAGLHVYSPVPRGGERA